MTETVQIPAYDHAGEIPAYVARPAGTPRAAIIVIPEIFGVNAGIREKCDDWAAQGYLAIAPDLFWRFAPGVELDPDVEAEMTQALGYFGQYNPDEGIKDIEATIRWARGQGVTKVGAVGYCLGGLLAFLTATRTDSDASVAYYGVGIEKNLIESEKQAHPLLMHMAEEDQFVPKEAQALILATLKNHPQIEIHTYRGRDHAFARRGGEHYNEADAKLAGGRTLAFFQQHLGA